MIRLIKDHGINKYLVLNEQEDDLNNVSCREIVTRNVHKLGPQAFQTGLN
jgi:hypothetical protein